MYNNWLTQAVFSVDNHDKYNLLKLAAEKIDLKNRYQYHFQDKSKIQFLDKLLEQVEREQEKLTITFGILVKNQERRITDVINRALPYCNHLIIVDTGSTDKTVEKIQQIDNPKISLHFKDWIEDFSKMRNHIIELNENDWLLFIDSDEYICDNSLSPEILKSMLALISILSENDNIALQLKIKKPFQNSHTLAERGLKKASSVRYFNKIHEELQANNIKHFKIDFVVENQGQHLKKWKNLTKNLVTRN